MSVSDPKIEHMRTAVYRHYDSGGNLLYVGISAYLPVRTFAHERASHWFSDVASIQVEWHENRSDALDAECLAIEFEKPANNTHQSKIRLSKLVSPWGFDGGEQGCGAAHIGRTHRRRCKPHTYGPMKTLAEYLKDKGRGAAADLAREIGVSESTVTRWARGAQPLVKVAVAIEDATGGAVSVRSWAKE